MDTITTAQYPQCEDGIRRAFHGTPGVDRTTGYVYAKDKARSVRVYGVVTFGYDGILNHGTWRFRANKSAKYRHLVRPQVGMTVVYPPAKSWDEIQARRLGGGSGSGGSGQVVA